MYIFFILRTLFKILPDPPFKSGQGWIMELSEGGARLCQAQKMFELVTKKRAGGKFLFLTYKTKKLSIVGKLWTFSETIKEL